MPEEFDYIIVGAGSAGCVLASRLSITPDARVLLEAGGRDNDPMLGSRSASAHWGYDRFDWGYVTEPEPNLDGRTDRDRPRQDDRRLVLDQRHGVYPRPPRRL